MWDYKLKSKVIVTSPKTRVLPFFLLSLACHFIAVLLLCFMMREVSPSPYEEGYPIELIYAQLESGSQRKQKEEKITSTVQAKNEPFTKKQSTNAKSVMATSFSKQNISELLVLQSGNPDPPYPMFAQENAIEGKVQIIVSVGKEGEIQNIDIFPPKAHPCLEQAVLETVKNWRFKPVNSLEFIQKKYEFIFKLE